MSGRIRSIKPDWLEDERMVLASSDARVLSVALILLADDYGNGRASVPLLVGRVFPGKPPETLANALEGLTGWFVLLYEVGGQRYFHLRNWKKHQRVDHPGKPQVPPPPEGLANLPETLVPDWKGMEGIGGEGNARGAPPPPDESEKAENPTICPLDLLEKAEKVGIVKDFVERYHVEPEQIRDGIREFVTHWTIAGGMGRKRSNWFRQLRQDLKFKCETPGKLRAPGEVEHGSRLPKRGGMGRTRVNPDGSIPSSNVPYHRILR